MHLSCVGPGAMLGAGGTVLGRAVMSVPVPCSRRREQSAPERQGWRRAEAWAGARGAPSQRPCPRPCQPHTRPLHRPRRLRARYSPPDMRRWHLTHGVTALCPQRPRILGHGDCDPSFVGTTVPCLWGQWSPNHRGHSPSSVGPAAPAQGAHSPSPPRASSPPCWGHRGVVLFPPWGAALLAPPSCGQSWGQRWPLPP